jgi:hypothetical protein
VGESFNFAENSFLTGSRSSAVHILTLRKHAAGHAFSELHRIEGSSHVLMLCGNLLGCALRDGAIVSHVINWKENRIHDIPGLDVSGHRVRSAFHWKLLSWILTPILRVFLI